MYGTSPQWVLNAETTERCNITLLRLCTYHMPSAIFDIHTYMVQQYIYICIDCIDVRRWRSSEVGPNQTCFELFGFDVLLDETLRPWLREPRSRAASADKGLGFRVQQPLVNSTVNFKSSTILGYDARVLSLIHYSHELTHLPVKHHVPGSHDEAFGCGCGAYGPLKPSSKNPPSPHANSKLLSADLIYIMHVWVSLYMHIYI